jgi:anthranilate synthase component 2
MILLIDNFDSFSYNVYQAVGTINPDIRVVRNNEISLDDIRALDPQRIILSPGPGTPEDAGICIDVVKAFAPSIPILGICLGHQAICTAFGATVKRTHHLLHGKTSDVSLDRTCPIFADVPSHITAGRYHSLAVDPTTIPDCLSVVARADDGDVMGVMHTAYPVYGVQFHPESILTPQGKHIIKAFVDGPAAHQEHVRTTATSSFANELENTSEGKQASATLPYSEQPVLGETRPL